MKIKKLYKNNRTGYPNVIYLPNKECFQAQKQVNKRIHYLGQFKTAKEAYEKVREFETGETRNIIILDKPPLGF